MAEGSTPPTPGEAPKRDISDARIHTVCLMILTGIAVAVALHHLATIMVPLSLSLFLCYGLTPLIDHQVALLRIPRALAVATTAGLGVVLLLLALQVVSSSASQLDAKRGVYNANLKALVTDFTSWVRIPQQSSALTVRRRLQTYCPKPLSQSSSAQYPASLASARRTAFCMALDTSPNSYPRFVFGSGMTL